MSEDKKHDLVEATGLWIKEGKNGKFFSGSMGNVQVLIFKNKYKTEDKHPDYIMYFGAKERKAPKPSTGEDII